MNSYNQIGLENETPKYLFRPIEDLFKKELQTAKKKEWKFVEEMLAKVEVSVESEQVNESKNNDNNGHEIGK